MELLKVQKIIEKARLSITGLSILSIIDSIMSIIEQVGTIRLGTDFSITHGFANPDAE